MKTIICDIDGTLLNYLHDKPLSERARTVVELEQARIPYDMLLMGFADTGRVLINDVGAKGNCKAHAVSLPRDEGFDEYDWGKVGL